MFIMTSLHLRRAFAILGLTAIPAVGQSPGRAIGTNSTPSVDGTAITYSVTGQGDPAIVFVHGWACDQSYWRDQVAYFPLTHLVVTLDLAGHGASGRGRRDWSIQRFGEDVAAVVRATGATKVVLIGHSLGGPVVVEAALQLPDQTMAVVGVDTFLDVWSTDSFANLIAGMRTDFVGTTTGFVRRSLFNVRSDTGLVSRVTSAMARIPPEVGIPAIASLGPWTSTRSTAAFAALRVPLGTIQASASGHTQLERARPSLTRLDANVMAGPGHFLMLEDPARFNATLDSLVQRLLK
jgi:pimeloyl-ACP methyl ester carboxylesterase